jgi:hypothetical protein
VDAACCSPLVVLAGAGGGRGGKEALGVGGPAGAGVAPVADDEGGVVLVVGEEIGLEGGEVEGSAAVVCGDEDLGAAAGPAQSAEW